MPLFSSSCTWTCPHFFFQLSPPSFLWPRVPLWPCGAHCNACFAMLSNLPFQQILPTLVLLLPISTSSTDFTITGPDRTYHASTDFTITGPDRTYHASTDFTITGPDRTYHASTDLTITGPDRTYHASRFIFSSFFTFNFCVCFVWWTQLVTRQFFTSC